MIVFDFVSFRRNHLVKEVILRYAGGSENTPTRDLLEQFKIPNKWIYEAEALKAKYEVNNTLIQKEIRFSNIIEKSKMSLLFISLLIFRVIYS